ncbi:MAG: hypothetical protein AAFR96_10930 [Planctomycetota bacterium]
MLIRTLITLSLSAFTVAPAASQTVQDVALVSVELDSGWTLESAVVNNELVGFSRGFPKPTLPPETSTSRGSNTSATELG